MRREKDFSPYKLITLEHDPQSLLLLMQNYLVEKSIVSLNFSLILQPDFHSEAFFLTGSSILMSSIGILLVILQLPGLGLKKLFFYNNHKIQNLIHDDDDDDNYLFLILMN